MTISPEVAKRIHSLVRAYRAWAKGIAEKDDWLTACALDDLKQAADDFQTICPGCGYPMITAQPRRRGTNGYTRTHLYCCQCRTSVVIATPPSHG